MASSIISICNSALAKLGAARIKSLTEGTKSSDLCQLRYEDCRDLVLQSHPWKCAIKRVVLSPSTPPAFGSESAFQVPSDYLRQLPKDKFTDLLPVEGSTILSNDTTVYLRYLARIEDATLYSPYLSECISLKLAADICYAFAPDGGKQKLQEELYENGLRRARFLDSSSSKANTKDSDTFLESRLSGTTAL